MIKSQLDPLTPNLENWRLRLLLRSPSKGLTVWLVDGKYVREKWDDDFIGGGHGYRYQFIPLGEVWIDDGTNKEEIPVFLIHELHERQLMQQGIDYESAHQQARAVEVSTRADLGSYRSILREEVCMQKDVRYMTSVLIAKALKLLTKEGKHGHTL